MEQTRTRVSTPRIAIVGEGAFPLGCGDIFSRWIFDRLSRDTRATERPCQQRNEKNLTTVDLLFFLRSPESPPHGRERIQLDCFKNVARICQFLQARACTRRSSISGRTSNVYIYSKRGYLIAGIPCALAFSRAVPSPTDIHVSRSRSRTTRGKNKRVKVTKATRFARFQGKNRDDKDGNDRDKGLSSNRDPSLVPSTFTAPPNRGY